MDYLELQAKVSKEYAEQLVKLRDIFFRADPCGIASDTNTDEYEPEAVRLLPQILKVSSVEEMEIMILEVFKQQFGDAIGDEKQYASIAQEVWRDLR